ncbi:MAG TPA: glycosyltransferase family 2 protein [Cyclobacteriaceae bacterium]|nr:glycosyltransferase family 2 protein [Cyclobacteriaceae bacterium]
MEKITASIVVYRNEIASVLKAAESFLASPLAGRLFIIDNSPTDSAKVSLQNDQIEYIHTGSNLGYGRAHNIALRKCLGSSDYHLVLNPDVFFAPDVIGKLYDFMEEHRPAGLVMPKVLYPNGTLQKLCKLLPTPFNLATRRFLPFSKLLLKSANDTYEMNFSHYNRVMNVPFLSGCFMFLRTSALKETGLFDERFFLYAEDTDLSRRIHRQFTTMFYPFAEIYHTHARGSYKNMKLTWFNFRSAVQYFNKWGWFFDEERRVINEAAIRPFKLVRNYGPVIVKETVVQRSMNE